jgi:hypothetical protein
MIYYFLSTSLNQSCAQLWQVYLQSQDATAAAAAAAAAAPAPAPAETATAAAAAAAPAPAPAPAETAAAEPAAAAAAAAATAPAYAAAPATPAGLSFADRLKEGKKLLTPPPTGDKRKEGASPFAEQLDARRQKLAPADEDSSQEWM